MGISIWQLLIVLGIVILLFGTKKLRNLGGDLASAVKSFKGAIKDGGKEDSDDNTMKKEISEDEGEVIDAEVTSRKKDEV